MSTWDRIADLPVEIDSYELEPLEREVSSAFTRLTTLIRLRGGGHDGVAEDVVYEALDHVAHQDAGPVLDLAGEHTIASLCELLGGLDLFPTPPVREISRAYRRAAFEAAALDLALHQAGRSLADALGRESRPVTYVVSLRLADEEPTAEPVLRRLEMYPSLRFKLDPTNEWSPNLIAELAATRAVDTLDLKGHYKGTPVDVETDPELYRLLLESFPDAWIEDPDVSPETRPILAEHSGRITWDAPVHSIRDIVQTPWKPRMVNIKPSRMGSLHELLDAYDFCRANDIGIYGGGQFELGPGRGQIQYLASLFHPDSPNDVSPPGFHGDEVPPGLPESPLEPQPAEIGFRWGE